MSSNYKRVLCVHFKKQGSCDMGGNCNFAHGNRELRSFENPLFKAQLCTAFEQGGICQMGTDCMFAHGEEELRSDDIIVPNVVERPVTSVSKVLPRSSKPAKDNLYKSTLCIHYSRHGSCNAGDKCTFA